ncbi:MAG: UPF0182 family protein [Synechococcales cyanobacterium]
MQSVWKRIEQTLQRWAMPVLVTSLLLWGVDLLVHFGVEAQWFNQLGYGPVLWTRVLGQLGVGVTAYALSWGLLWANLRYAWNTWQKVEDPADQPKPSLSLSWRILVSLLALGIALQIQQDWLNIILSTAGIRTGEWDPIFKWDVGFYFFVLPVWIDWQQSLSTLAWVGLAITALLYTVLLGITLRNVSLRLPKEAISHLLFLVTVIFCLRAWGHVLNGFQLLYSRRGSHFGANYTDVWAQLPGEVTLAVLSLGLAGWVLWLAISQPDEEPGELWPHYQIWLTLGLIVSIYALGLGLIGRVWPHMIQVASVDANELQRDLPFIEHNIHWTQKGFNLTEVEVNPFKIDSQQAAGNGELTLKNIPLWDPEPLLASYQQLQEIRLYYQLREVDVDRYRLDNQWHQVMISARELDYQQIPQRAQTWTNEHFFYTHGYGLALSPVNAVTPAGLPDFWVKDIPPVVVPPIRDQFPIRNPAIYFGESTRTNVFVKADAEELDYPEENENILADYQGNAGIPVGTPAQRLLLAWYFRDPRFVWTSNTNPSTRFLMWRQIQDRIHRIAPFFVLDPNPYLVVDQGHLVWMQDAYTVSNLYPYSEPAAIPTDNRWQQPRLVNYIRNAVKITVDAYDGRIRFYINDPSDPILKAYQRLFPSLLQPLQGMPDSLRQHLRYPEYLFRLQAQQYGVYHMRDPRAFYNKEDQWDLVRQVRERGSQILKPYYQVLQLPSAADPKRESEMVMLTSFTPHNRQNLIAWMAARCDQPHYGQLLVYQFSKQELILGPQQVEARIVQDPQISAQLTLWDEAGSHVSMGNLLVIPLPNTLLYVQPIYIEAENSRLPQLIRVVVADQNQVIMTPRLEEGLHQLFPDQFADVTPMSPLRRLTEQAWDQWQQLQRLELAGREDAVEALSRQLSATLEELYQTVDE